MKLLAIDGNSLINRAYYGVRALSNSKGVPTNAVYGFLNMYFKLIEDNKPDCVCVCFDLKAKTFRHLKYEEYKAQRKPMPEELCVQMPIIKDVLDKMGIPRLEAEGFEADDLLGTLARLSREEGTECVIVTGDRDSLQFIDQGAKVALVTTRMGNTETELYDEELFAEKYCGLSPIKIIDLKAIMGDPSDNIPGVRGIGEKGALSLICEFGSLDGVYENIDSPKISESTRKKLTESRDMAYLSYELATGCLTAPVDKKPHELKVRHADEEGLFGLLSELELRSIIKKLDLKPGTKAPDKKDFVMPDHKMISDGSELRELVSALPGELTVFVNRALTVAAVFDGKKVYSFSRLGTGEAFDGFISSLAGKNINAHDCKSFASCLLKEGKTPPRFVFDSALAAYLLSSTDGEYGLRTLADKYFGFEAKDPLFDENDAFDLFGGGEDALFAAAQYCAIDAALKDVLTSELESTGQLALLSDIELPTSMVLAEMEAAGIKVDRKHLFEFGRDIGEQADKLQKEIYELAGEEFNISSPRQLSDILFEKLKLPHGKKNKTGAYTTDAETLSKLRFDSEIVEKILDYRKLTKLKSTYVDGLSKTIASDGCIHGTFNQTVTATGRLSSTEPNLQNLPVRRELGAEIRKCFVPREGNVFVSADYSQIELRILAHISDDKAMKEAFEKGEDIHTVTASEVFRVPREMVNPMMRSRAKAVNFGIVYGISAFSLSSDVGVSVKEAQSYINAYLDKFTGVRDYMERIKNEALSQGFVSTIFGRRRYIPELKSANHNTVAFGQRVALNAPIQGTAADIIKKAMVNVKSRLERDGLKGRIVLQIHDELVVECPGSELAATEKALCEEMENAASLSVRLLCDAGHGENLYDAKS